MKRTEESFQQGYARLFTGGDAAGSTVFQKYIRVTGPEGHVVAIRKAAAAPIRTAPGADDDSPLAQLAKRARDCRARHPELSYEQAFSRTCSTPEGVRLLGLDKAARGLSAA